MTPIRLAVPLALLAALTFAPAAQAAAWWQFVSVNSDGSRRVHSPYKDEEACQTALKKVEAEMKKKFPEQFPLVGSCEHYESDK